MYSIYYWCVRTWRAYWTSILLGVVVIAAFALRVINLNYNSPFNDEAIYIVVGRLGLFQGDWWTYNAAAWMAGQPYIYPPLAAMSYMIGGIVGSRFLSVVFGVLVVEAIYELTRLLVKSNSFLQSLSGIIAAIVAAVATTGLYVSRLATYDMPSFYFTISALVFLLKAEGKKENIGKWYFLAFVFLTMAFFTKIVIGMYVPLIFIYSLLMAKKIGKEQFHFWFRYFAAPIVLILGSYLILNFHNLLTYAISQGARDKNLLTVILKTFWTNTMYVWGLWALASISLLFKKQWKIWLIFTSLSLLILVFHIFTQREPTLDKHTYLSILFLAPLIGIGLANFIHLTYEPIAHKLIYVDLLVLLVFFGFISYRNLYKFNNLWHNSTPVLNYLQKDVQPGDKVLAEVGASAILATYDKNFPTYTVTFDWFEYKNLSGEKAFLSAMNDGYFDWIELDGGDQTFAQIHSKMHNLVLNNIAGNYKMTYQDNGYLVYKRSF